MFKIIGRASFFAALLFATSIPPATASVGVPPPGDANELRNEHLRLRISPNTEHAAPV